MRNQRPSRAAIAHTRASHPRIIYGAHGGSPSLCGLPGSAPVGHRVGESGGRAWSGLVACLTAAAAAAASSMALAASTQTKARASLAWLMGCLLLCSLQPAASMPARAATPDPVRGGRHGERNRHTGPTWMECCAALRCVAVSRPMSCRRPRSPRCPFAPQTRQGAILRAASRPPPPGGPAEIHEALIERFSTCVRHRSGRPHR